MRTGAVGDGDLIRRRFGIIIDRDRQLTRHRVSQVLQRRHRPQVLCSPKTKERVERKIRKTRKMKKIREKRGG